MLHEVDHGVLDRGGLGDGQLFDGGDRVAEPLHLTFVGDAEGDGVADGAQLGVGEPGFPGPVPGAEEHLRAADDSTVRTGEVVGRLDAVAGAVVNAFGTKALGDVVVDHLVQVADRGADAEHVFIHGGLGGLADDSVDVLQALGRRTDEDEAFDLGPVAVHCGEDEADVGEARAERVREVGDVVRHVALGTGPGSHQDLAVRDVEAV